MALPLEDILYLKKKSYGINSTFIKSEWTKENHSKISFLVNWGGELTMECGRNREIKGAAKVLSQTTGRLTSLTEMNKCVKGANLREKIGSLVLTMLGLTLPLDIQWRCWIGSLLDPLEMRWEGRTGVVSIEMVFNTQDLISPPETQYISSREHLRAESWATPIFGGWDMRKNQHQGWRRSLNQENVGPGSQGKKCFKGGSDQQCQLADRW